MGEFFRCGLVPALFLRGCFLRFFEGALGAGECVRGGYGFGRAALGERGFAGGGD